MGVLREPVQPFGSASPQTTAGVRAVLPEKEPSAVTPNSVLHLVGRITDTVFSFLGPATAALAGQGVSQTIVLVDDPRYRHLLARFEPSVQLVLIDDDASFRKRHAKLLEAYCRTARSMMPTAAHLHGAVCLMLGLYAERAQKLAVPTFFTPHGSSALSPLLSFWGLLTRFLRPVSTRLGDAIIASSGAEARQMKDMMRSVHLVESPVSRAFFHEIPHADAVPHIVTGNRAPNPQGAALFTQCAVLLSDELPNLCFSWIGTASTESKQRMHAAGVKVVDIKDDAMRARQMAGAWIFIAPGGSLGFPVFLAEAMALGLPCVAWDTPNHRDLIRHGDTGFLCRDTDDALERLAELLESPELRQRIGKAARVEASTRFDSRRFRKALLGIYGMRRSGRHDDAGINSTQPLPLEH